MVVVVGSVHNTFDGEKETEVTRPLAQPAVVYGDLLFGQSYSFVE